MGSTIRLLPAIFCLFFFAPAVAQDDTAAATALEHAGHVKMHKNPGCSCCEVWADHLRSFGFTVESIPNPALYEFKEGKHIPRQWMSCHTAEIGDYFIEGHVPARDILSLLRDKPENVSGLLVPGMPLGSPGMEHPRPQTFNTLALLEDGSAYVFSEHIAGEDFTNTDEE